MDPEFTTDLPANVDYYCYDHLGNTRTVFQFNDCATKALKVMSMVDYYPYGKVLREYHVQEEKYLTTQHERDSETGFDYRGARFYDSQIAKFLSLDPLAHVFPLLSPYCYVAANPIRFLDKDGKAPSPYDDNQYRRPRSGYFEHLEALRKSSYEWQQTQRGRFPRGTLPRMGETMRYLEGLPEQSLRGVPGRSGTSVEPSAIELLTRLTYDISTNGGYYAKQTIKLLLNGTSDSYIERQTLHQNSGRQVIMSLSNSNSNLIYWKFLQLETKYQLEKRKLIEDMWAARADDPNAVIPTAEIEMEARLQLGLSPSETLELIMAHAARLKVLEIYYQQNNSLPQIRQR